MMSKAGGVRRWYHHALVVVLYQNAETFYVCLLCVDELLHDQTPRRLQHTAEVDALRGWCDE